MSDIRDEIIAAARDRFAHYGYQKTTMAEIAADCNMSPGNLYRYFPGKLDIAVAIAKSHLDGLLEELREIVKRPGLSAKDRLQTYLRAELRRTFQSRETADKLADLLHMVRSGKAEVLKERIRKERVLIAEILSLGVAAGEFKLQDVMVSAEYIQAATTLFRYPFVNDAYDLAELERQLDGVCELIFKGICPGEPVESTPGIRPYPRAVQV